MCDISTLIVLILANLPRVVFLSSPIFSAISRFFRSFPPFIPSLFPLPGVDVPRASRLHSSPSEPFVPCQTKINLEQHPFLTYFWALNPSIHAEGPSEGTKCFLHTRRFLACPTKSVYLQIFVSDFH